MKTRLLYLLIILMLPLALNAQRQGRKFEETLEKFKAERVAYLTTKLDLTIEEAEKFWPLYNEYNSKREKMMREGRPANRRPDPETLSTEKMEKLMDTKINNDLKAAKLAQDYYLKYKEILPVKKVFILYQAEQDFMSTMLRKMRGHERSNPGIKDKAPNQDGR